MADKETGLEFLARIEEQKASRARQRFSDEVDRLKEEERCTTAPAPVEVAYMDPLREKTRSRGW